MSLKRSATPCNREALAGEPRGLERRLGHAQHRDAEQVARRGHAEIAERRDDGGIATRRMLGEGRERRMRADLVLGRGQHQLGAERAGHRHDLGARRGGAARDVGEGGRGFGRGVGIDERDTHASGPVCLGFEHCSGAAANHGS